MRFENSIERRIAGKHRANSAMADFRGKKVLDIGCGIGIFEKYCNAGKILAIDTSREDIEVVRKEVERKNVKFILGDILKLNIKDKFDIITLFDVIEHVPKNSELKLLNKLYKSLKKRGILLITTPKDNFTKFLDIAWYFGHRHYTAGKISELLEKSGFKTEKIYARGGIFEIVNMFLFYIFKWIFNSEVPFKNYLDKKRDEEYKREGFVTLFIIAKKD